MPIWSLKSRRLYYGYLSQAAVAAQNSFVGLYNDGAVGEHLSVVSVGNSTTSGIIATWRKLKPGVQTMAVGAVVTPMIAEMPKRPGVLYSGSVAPLPTADFRLAIPQALVLTQMRSPFLVLPPGWACEVYHETVNTLLALTIIFQIDERADFDDDAGTIEQTYLGTLKALREFDAEE